MCTKQDMINYIDMAKPELEKLIEMGRKETKNKSFEPILDGKIYKYLSNHPEILKQVKPK